MRRDPHTLPDCCPCCDAEITGDALAAHVHAGMEWDCPYCGERLRVFEHTDGWTNWMTFLDSTEAAFHA